MLSQSTTHAPTLVTNFYKRLASLLADKWEQPYSTTLYWLRCSISFSLLRSAIQCIRGARVFKGPCCETFTSRPGDCRGQPTADVFCDFSFTPLLYITTFHFFIDRLHIFHTLVGACAYTVAYRYLWQGTGPA